MTPKERADDIMGRCWWRPEEHPGELRPLFAGLGPEIEAAIREAVAERTEAAAKVVQKAPNERTWVCPEDAPAVSVLIPPSQADLAALIRAMKEAE